MSAPSIGVYGKVDTQGDFVRAGSGDFSLAGLDRWLDESIGALKTQQLVLPEGAAGFLFAPPASPRAFLGGFAPGEDSVGRRFPLLVFLELPAPGVSGALAAAATLYAHRFVDAAARLALESRGLASAEVIARAQALAAVAPAAALEGDEVVSLANEPTAPLREALGGAPAALAYALRTLTLACDNAAKADASAPGITIDAPAPTPATRALWVALVASRLKRAGAPAPSVLLWSEAGDGAGGRLLVGLGAPATTVFTFWASPRHRSQRLWPLRTDVAAALATATAALTPSQRRVVDDPAASLSDLAAEFS
jgi:type VI secretion system protein ImpM